MLSPLRFNRASLAALGIAITVALAAGPVLAAPATQDGHAGHAQHHAQATPPTDAHAQHGHDAAAPPVPPTGQRWTTDAPLQDGMGRIRQAVTMLEHLEMGHVDSKQAPALADQIRSAINYMIANCKLAPDADATLHGLLVKFIAGADAVRTGPVTLDELKPMQEALAQYPMQFDDPTWDVNHED